MYNFCAKFQQILDICKCHCENLVNSLGNEPHRGAVPRFSDLEVIALSMTAEAFGIDSESYLFRMLSRSGDGIPNLISRKQYNDRRKSTTSTIWTTSCWSTTTAASSATRATSA